MSIHPVSRVSWNVSLLLVILFETEVTVQHNSSSAFATRPTYVSWQTIVAWPTLLLLDIMCAKLEEATRQGVLWSKITCFWLHFLGVVVLDRICDSTPSREVGRQCCCECGGIGDAGVVQRF